MVNIKINSKGTGACPQCKHSICHIQHAISVRLNGEVEAKFDENMEIVIYKCPEFVEK